MAAMLWQLCYGSYAMAAMLSEVTKLISMKQMIISKLEADMTTRDETRQKSYWRLRRRILTLKMPFSESPLPISAYVINKPNSLRTLNASNYVNLCKYLTLNCVHLKITFF